ncbi:MAG: cyclic nucleotide-binding domain-containing protein [Rhodospirillales bacterium]|nr:cyclic nucleotide-binding domain-containing protein [Rhodospirillales bacterium]
MSEFQRKFDDGDIIFHEGQRSTSAFVVVSGRVELLKKGSGGKVRLAVLGTGEVFGEMGVINRQERSATARAIGNVTLEVIERDQYMEQLRDDPDKAMQIVEQLSERLRATNEMAVKPRRGILFGKARDAGGPSIWDAVGLLMAQRREKKRMLEVKILPLTGDPEGTQTAHLSAMLGADRTIQAKIIPEAAQLDARSPSPAVITSVQALGRGHLIRSKADLLIWGSVNEVQTSMNLRFVPGAGDGDYPGAVLPTDRLVLPINFSPEFARLLKAVTIAATVPSSEAQRMWLQPLLLSALDEAQEAGQSPPSELTSADRMTIQACFGNVIASIGHFRGDVNWLRQAAEAYQDVWDNIERLEAPSDWGSILFHLARVRHALGERARDGEGLGIALKNYETASEFFNRADFPHQWASLQMRMGNTLYRLDSINSDTEVLKDAIAHFHTALQIFTRTEAPFKWSELKNSLGQALQVWGDLNGSTEILERAVASCQEALQLRTREETPFLWASSQNNLGSALFLLGRITEHSEHIEGASQAFSKALEIYLAFGMERLARVTERNLAKADNLLRLRRARPVAHVKWEDQPDSERAAHLESLRARSRQIAGVGI